MLKFYNDNENVSLQESNRECIGKVVKSLLALLKQKSYLAELCAKLIVDILEKVCYLFLSVSCFCEQQNVLIYFKFV